MSYPSGKPRLGRSAEAASIGLRCGFGSGFRSKHCLLLNGSYFEDDQAQLSLGALQDQGILRQQF